MFCTGFSFICLFTVDLKSSFKSMSAASLPQLACLRFLGPADVFVPGTVGGQVSDDRRHYRIHQIFLNLGFAFGSGESAAAQQGSRRYGVYTRSAMSHRGAAEPRREGEEGRNVGCHDNPSMSIPRLPASRLRMPNTPPPQTRCSPFDQLSRSWGSECC